MQNSDLNERLAGLRKETLDILLAGVPENGGIVTRHTLESVVGAAFDGGVRVALARKVTEGTAQINTALAPCVENWVHCPSCLGTWPHPGREEPRR